MGPGAHQRPWPLKVIQQVGRAFLRLMDESH
jgi:hypothetical protein